MSQSGCQKHLNAIRDNALYGTRERVEDTCRLARVHSIFLTDLSRYVTYREDGNGVVCRTEVDKTDKGSNGELRASFAMDS